MSTDSVPNVICMTLEEAEEILTKNGYSIRVLEIDDEVRAGTCDYDRSRVTLKLKNNKVTSQITG